ncbi:MAG: HepT-like ribonuclease domain-containing protein [bacterium]
MSKKSDMARLESILDYIDDIEKITIKHGSVQGVLSDMEGQYAILMCLQQIGEILNKIKSEEYRSILPIKGAIGFRNVIVHDYNGINLSVAKLTIEQQIPELRKTIQKIMKHDND